MVNGSCHFGTRSGNFGFQQRDARFEFIDGKGFQILPTQLCQRIIRLGRQIIIRIHMRNVDPIRQSVNKGDIKFTLFCATQHVRAGKGYHGVG